MKEDYTHFTFVLDRSGSMGSSMEETLQGLDKFINQNKIKGKICTYSLYVFDNEITEKVLFNDIRSYKTPIIELGGMTALFDAFVISIDKTGKIISEMQEKDRPEKVIMMTLTDGGENSSKEFKVSDVKSRIEEQKTKYNWEFVFLGADFNIDSYARNFGLDKKMSRNINKSNIANSLESIGASLSVYRSTNYNSKSLDSLESIGE